MRKSSSDNTFVKTLNIGNRACRCLCFLQVKSPEDFKAITTSQICSFPGIGKKTLDEIVAAAARCGYKIHEDRCKNKDVVAPNPNVVSELAKYDPNSEIDVLGLTYRTINVLKTAGIFYIKNLITLCPYQILEIEGCGRHMWREIRDKVTECGYEFARQDIEDLGLSRLSLGFLRKKNLTSISKILESIDTVRVCHGRMASFKIRDEIVTCLISKGYLPDTYIFPFANS